MEVRGITDSPVGWVAGHIQKYVEIDGASGHRYQRKAQWRLPVVVIDRTEVAG
ncbi:hypothetical protein [Nonomuraea guangzhouensis]|uniref:Uncharacterized protein n=1 Tax=Nonomuraea guangzhouensis TaxID=1291555 RepID=A0ABW4FYI6_9ACTN|nr:hypothetical protein [Nonomuraea guangzhouensis]